MASCHLRSHLICLLHNALAPAPCPPPPDLSCVVSCRARRSPSFCICALRHLKRTTKPRQRQKERERDLWPCIYIPGHICGALNPSLVAGHHHQWDPPSRPRLRLRLRHRPPSPTRSSRGTFCLASRSLTSSPALPGSEQIPGSPPLPFVTAAAAAAAALVRPHPAALARLALLGPAAGPSIT
ncbi:hypothetical protein GGR56DRAFT_10007 [Xylariaceae sp. FL0804]|nr:hypothetical protein GGR56DRAFT_10007 [Xylariaceae sp. FL0804]